MYFETIISYDKIIENGQQKRVEEHYIVDALSFTEAEARIITEITQYITGQFSVKSIKRDNISEIAHNQDADKYYRCKVNLIILDQRSGAEKKIASHILIQSTSVDEAGKALGKHMKGTFADYEVEGIKESKIMEVYHHEV